MLFKPALINQKSQKFVKLDSHTFTVVVDMKNKDPETVAYRSRFIFSLEKIG